MRRASDWEAEAANWIRWYSNSSARRVIERIREPAASEAAVAAGGDPELRWRRVPVFLQILDRKG